MGDRPGDPAAALCGDAARLAPNASKPTATRSEALYDERFCRMWEFYLVGCELSFRHMNQMVFQMQIAKRQHAVPTTRDYITDFERANASRVAAA